MAKILYMPILEPGAHHETAVTHKRGLLDALIRAGNDVWQYDYLDRRNSGIYAELAGLITDIQPDLVISQFHGADVLNPPEIEGLRALRPEMKWANWSGDSWLHSLIAQPMIDLIRKFDVQLVAAPDVIKVYDELGITSAYWQIAYEPPVGELPDVPAYDVVFLGNVLTEDRRKLMEMLRTLPYKVGIYGDWEHADGKNDYHFAAGEALYKNARLAISDNPYPDQKHYISNRPIHILMARGAMMLHEHVKRMESISYGWEDHKHYVRWDDLDHLKKVIGLWMDSERDDFRNRIVDAGYRHASEHHTYDARVKQLFDEILPMVEGLKA